MIKNLYKKLSLLPQALDGLLGPNDKTMYMGTVQDNVGYVWHIFGEWLEK